MPVFTLGRKILCSFLACGLLVSTATAQPLPDRRPLTGRVTREDGKPIKGAQIVLRKQEDVFAAAYWGDLTVSNENGNFSFPDAEEGNYYLTVEAGGFAPEQSKAVQLNDSTAPLTITLAKLVPFALRLLKPDGTPLKDSKVVVRLRGDGARGQRFPSGKTDASGLFTFTAEGTARSPLIPGKYYIGVVAPGSGYANLDSVDVQAPAGKPENTPLTIDVKLQPGGTLRATARGHVEGGEPRAIGGASLSLAPVLKNDANDRAAGELGRIEDMGSQIWFGNYGGGSLLVTRDGDGTVELADLPVGRYAARLILPGLPPQGRQEFEVTANGTSTLNFDFPLAQPAAELRITIQNAKGEPLANTDVELNLRQIGGNEAGTPPLPPDVIQNGAVAMPGMLFRRAHTDAAGQITLFPITPGKWSVRLMGEEPDRPGRRRELSAAQTVTLTKEGGTLTITTDNGKP